jgi:TrmH family RNA methyltransferase
MTRLEETATITSRVNPLFKRLRTLKERDRQREVCLLEGPRLILEAIAAGVEIVEAVTTPEAATRFASTVAGLRSRGAPIRRMRAAILATLSEAETSQGLLAIARRPAFAEEAVFRGVPLVLVAVGVQNPGNVGALLRAAEAAGATGAYLTAGCADPFSWKALRGSMGSAFRLPHVRGLAAPAVLDRLEARGLTVLAAEPGGGQPYDRADLTRPLALLLGSEGAGLPPALTRRAAARVSIPLDPRVESLNVAVAAGVLLFEAARQRRAAGSC